MTLLGQVFHVPLSGPLTVTKSLWRVGDYLSAVLAVADSEVLLQLLISGQGLGLILGALGRHGEYVLHVHLETNFGTHPIPEMPADAFPATEVSLGRVVAFNLRLCCLLHLPEPGGLVWISQLELLWGAFEPLSRETSC